MRNILSILLLTLFCACNSTDKPMVIPKKAIQNLQGFKNESKFDPETQTLFYPGLSKPELKSNLTVLINKAADDFISTANDNPTEKKFQNDIKHGLERFTPFYLDLDTEDLDRVCSYFENLMDCVGLESSDGQLNNWRYGFDPTSKN